MNRSGRSKKSELQKIIKKDNRANFKAKQKPGVGQKGKNPKLNLTMSEKEIEANVFPEKISSSNEREATIVDQEIQDVSNGVEVGFDHAGTSDQLLPIGKQSMLVLNSSGLPSEQAMRKTKAATSAVWDHFVKFRVRGESQCNHCKFVIKSLNATNTKRHLKTCMPELFPQVETKDAAHNPKRPSSIQPKLSSNIFAKQYPKNRPKQLKFRRKLTYFVATGSVSSRAMQRTEFKDCIKVADPQLKVPSRTTMERDVKILLKEAREKISTLLKSARRITLCSDIWTKRGQCGSFLGVTASFYSPILKKRVNAVLGVRKFSSVTHKAADIIREMRSVLAEYEVRPECIWRALTDGGSNMVASHKKECNIFCQEDKQKVHDIIEADEYAEEAVTSDSEFEDSLEEDQECLLLEDTSEDQQMLQEDSPSMSSTYKRLTYFIHTTLNCLKVFDQDEFLQVIISRVKSLQAKFGKSHVLMEELVQAAGVGFVKFCETRWNYIYNVFSRLVRIRNPLNSVLTAHKKTKYIFTPEEWSVIEECVQFLKPFSDYTNMSTKETEPVASEVCLSLISMQAHLNKYENSDLFRVVAKNINKKFKEKFSHWLKDSVEHPLEGTYLAAMALDPRYKISLPEDKLLLAKKYLLREFELMSEDCVHGATHTASQNSEEPMPASKFPILQEIRAFLLSEKSQNQNSTVDAFRIELQDYLSTQYYDYLNDAADVFEFWNNKRLEFPLLAPLALDYLAIPASSANVERVFSTGGLLTIGDKNRLDGENLEARIILTRNEKLLTQLEKF